MSILVPINEKLSVAGKMIAAHTHLPYMGKTLPQPLDLPFFEDDSNAELKENVLSIMRERMFSIMAPPPGAIKTPPPGAIESPPPGAIESPPPGAIDAPPSYEDSANATST